MKNIIPFLLLFFLGCGTTQVAEVPTEIPELVKAVPLPAMTPPLPLEGLRVSVNLLVLKDGTVGSAGMIGSTGVPDWDSAVLQSVKQWEFRPARLNGEPTDRWIRQSVVVRPQEQVIHTLGELVSLSKEEADSLYKLIEDGISFESLAGNAQVGLSSFRSGFLGAVDIGVFPMRVRSELQRLRQGSVTQPLKVGDHYVIFRRYRDTHQ